MSIKEFFGNAFQDMKESAHAQHEVDKAELAAVKAESKARFEEAKSMSNPDNVKRAMQQRHKEQLDEANKRTAAAQARISAATGEK